MGDAGVILNRQMQLQIKMLLPPYYFLLTMRKMLKNFLGYFQMKLLVISV